MRLAVIGAGLIGKTHIELINGHGDCALVGICDTDISRKSVAEASHIPFYQDIEAMIDREKPEGVIIATPNSSHAGNAEICANRSVHVMIEKPIADTLDGATRIIKAGENSDIQVLIGHHRRYNPRIIKAHDIVKDGVIGKLVAVSMMWALLKPEDYFEVDWRCARPGGGPTCINLIHEIDTLRFICGEIRSVYAQSSSDVRKLEVEDSVQISLSFENGALGSVVASDTTPSPWSYEATTRENPYYFHANQNCYYFLGTLGSLAFPNMELWRYPDKRQTGWQYPMEMTLDQMTEGEPLVSQLTHFCRVIRGVEQPLVGSRDGARSLAAAMAVLESSQRQVSAAPLRL